MTAADPRANWDEMAKAYARPDLDAQAASTLAFFAPDAAISVVHPINECTGAQGYIDEVLSPLHAAFGGLIRTDQIVMANADWVAATGYYLGRFDAPWLGLTPTGAMTFLRYAEFHKVNAVNQATESFVFFDLPELMIATGQWPSDIPSPAAQPGHTGYLPGPMAQDGLAHGRDDGAQALGLVQDMLLQLATPNEAWRPFWHDHMIWYGPAAFGSFYGIEAFADFQTPFEGCFSSWVGGSNPGSETKHFTRFADGPFVCSGGWPSLNAHQIHPFLGQPATDKTLYMRVCDFWRREGDKLLENWVFVDIPHVLLQMGRDVLAEGRST